MEWKSVLIILPCVSLDYPFPCDEIRFENENCHASREAAGGRFDGETRYE